jgi:hypothetical protein
LSSIPYHIHPTLSPTNVKIKRKTVKIQIKMQKPRNSLSAYRLRLTAERNKKIYTCRLCSPYRIKNKKLQVLNVEKWYVGLGLAESGRRIADSVLNHFAF